MPTLQNTTALVTGASRGIGRATAVALAEAGAHVLIHYGRSTQEAESLAAAIHPMVRVGLQEPVFPSMAARSCNWQQEEHK